MGGWNMQEQGNTSFSQQGNLPTGARKPADWSKETCQLSKETCRLSSKETCRLSKETCRLSKETCRLQQGNLPT
jgi:hypothetical protein